MLLVLIRKHLSQALLMSNHNIIFSWINRGYSNTHDKHLNFLFIIYITFDRRDANLAFARESLTRSYVPWRHDVHVLFCLVTLDMTSETRIGV